MKLYYDCLNGYLISIFAFKSTSILPHNCRFYNRKTISCRLHAIRMTELLTRLIVQIKLWVRSTLSQQMDTISISYIRPILLATGALRLIKSFYLNLQLTVQFSHSICRVLTHCYSISHTDKTKLYS